jgi:hypothetical protein
VALPATAQELDVTRHSFNFVQTRLDVLVLAEAPGELQLVRGGRGRVEVAARSLDGFASFGLGGRITPELRLTAIGSEAVRYIVSVPENVTVRVRLPQGQNATLAPAQPAGSFHWGGATAAGDPSPQTGSRPGAPGPAAPGSMALDGPRTLITAHQGTQTPTVMDIPDFASVRSLQLRFGGDAFRISASRPLAVQPGSDAFYRLQLQGDPLDLMIHIPSTGAPFALWSGDVLIAEYTGAVPTTPCRSVAIQRGEQGQAWFSFYPRDGQLDCR